MKRKYSLQAIVLGSLILAASVGVSGCGKYSSADVPGSSTGGDASASFENNTDITAGINNEDGTYYCEASIGDGEVSVTVDALSDSVKTSDFSNIATISDKSETALNDVRKQYMMNYFEEDETTAEQDLDELYSDPSTPDEYLSGIQKYYDELSKVFSQFGIVHYDFTAPYINNTKDANSAFFEFDCYTDDYRLFYVDVSFNGDSVSSIDIYEDDDLSASSSTTAAEGSTASE